MQLLFLRITRALFLCTALSAQELGVVLKSMTPFGGDKIFSDANLKKIVAKFDADGTCPPQQLR